MCGFVVACHEKISKNTMEVALKSLKHRGPDEQGIWQNDKKDITLGHARLSIIDLNSGLQPISNQDQSLVAVVNGEFYDHQQIHQELANDGYKFKSTSDSEILLGLYERYGTRCLKFLRGEFAFVLYDKKNRLFFSARDYFGIKPLFYTQVGKAFYFASEVKAFRALGLRLAWDEDNFFQTISMFPMPDGSLFANVKQIPPAHYLVKSEFNNSIHLQSYWDFNYPKEGAKKPISEEQAIQGFHDVFKEAVNLRLKADVPVGCYLSGGLDSCSVLGFAQSMSNKPVQSFTLTFDHADYDERSQAEEMAKFCGASFHPIAISQDDIAEGFEDAIWHAERPIFNGHGVAKYWLSKAVNKAGLKVVLTGEGSDEIFGGYAHFRQDVIASDQISQEEKAKLLERLNETNRISSGILLASEASSVNKQVEAQLGFIPHWMQGFASFEGRIGSFLSDETKNKYQGRNHLSYVLNHLDIAGQVDGRDHLSGSLYLWSRIMLPYYLLTVLGDRMEMAHSIEGRLPFLDHKVVEYVVALPSNLKVQGLKEKVTLREAAKPYITKTIYERQKHPFMAPPSLAAKNNRMAMLIEDTLRGRELAKIPFINQKKVIEMLDNLKNLGDAEKAQSDFLLMSLTSACMIQKRFELSV